MSFITVERKVTRRIGSSADYSHKTKRDSLYPRWSSFVAETTALVEAVIIVGSAIIAGHIDGNWFLGDTGGPVGDRQTTIAGFAGLGVVLAFIYSYVNGKLALSEPDPLTELSTKIGQHMFALSLSFLGMLGLLLLLNISQDYSRGFILTWLSISAFSLIVERTTVHRWVRGLQAKGVFKTPIAIYGSPLERHRAREAFKTHSSNIDIVGIFAPHQDETDVEVSGGLKELISFGQNNDCDQIVITLPLSAKEEIREAVERLSVLPVDLLLLPNVEVPGVSIRGCRVIDRLPAFEVQLRPFSHHQYLAKSAIDLILSTSGLVLLAPILILAALAIKLDSPGPVFFRQRRHGYNHKVIQVLKFRTMNVMENDGEIKQARPDDDRVTRVGRLLRWTSIDELPQLWNVLKGEMSLVGPRPHALSHNIYYASLWENYSNRHRVKPGITGWAQVNGLRGQTSDPEQMRKRAEHDLYYIENWSLALDLEILLRTAAVVLKAKNAH